MGCVLSCEEDSPPHVPQLKKIESGDTLVASAVLDFQDRISSKDAHRSLQCSTSSEQGNQKVTKRISLSKIQVKRPTSIQRNRHICPFCPSDPYVNELYVEDSQVALTCDALDFHLSLWEKEEICATQFSLHSMCQWAVARNITGTFSQIRIMMQLDAEAYNRVQCWLNSLKHSGEEVLTADFSSDNKSDTSEDTPNDTGVGTSNCAGHLFHATAQAEGEEEDSVGLSSSRFGEEQQRQASGFKKKKMAWEKQQQHHAEKYKPTAECRNQFFG